MRSVEGSPQQWVQNWFQLRYVRIQRLGRWRRMKAMQVIARMNVGGTARYVGRLAEALPGRGIDVELVTGYVQDSEVEDPVVERLEPSRARHLGRRLHLLNDLQARAELRELIQQGRPDVIHSHTFKAGALIRSLRLNVPVVHTFHGHLFDDPDFQGRRAQVITVIERGLAGRASRIVTVGEVVGQDLLQRGIGKPEQFVSIPPGVDALDLPSRDQARQELRVPADSVTVAWVARVTDVKGPHRVISLAERFPTATFLMAGGGNLLDDMRRDAPSNLHVLGWAPAALVYGASDVALSTSFNEGMPVSLIEAQLAGLPVVANDVGSVREVVQNEETGFVGTTADLSDNLGSLIEDGALRQAMGARARERSQRLFAPQQMVRAHADLYTDLVEGR